MANHGVHLTQGAEIVPAPDNPLSGQMQGTVQEAAEEAMKQAQEAAESGEVPVNDLEDDGKAAEAGEKSTEDAAREALEADKGEDADKAGETDPETPEIGPLEPPTAWSPEDQEVFRGIADKDVQDWILKFAERQVAPVQTQFDQLQPVKRVLDNYNSYLTQIGQPVDRVVEGLLQTEYLLRTGTPQQKAQAFAKIAQDYGIELGQPTAPALPEDIASDPVAQALDERLNKVMERLDGLQSNVQTGLGSFQAQQQNAAQAQLDAFKAEKDEKGNLKHPYYAEVEPMMEALAAAANARGQQMTLEQVYDSACMADATVRTKIESARQAAQIRERQKTAAEKSKASKSVSSSPGGTQTESSLKVKPGESAYDTVMRAFEQHGGTLP